MEIYKVKNYDEMSKKAANILSAQIVLNPSSVLGFATGASPIGTYRILVERHQCGDLDFSNISTINLDEYKGLSPNDSQSYYHFMWENLFKHININPKNVHIPNGLETSVELECERYDNIIEGFDGADIQLLGIGTNGHIGFNEPSDIFEKSTHCVKLTESTIDSNVKYFGSREDMPKYAYTMGIGSIMKSKRIVLLASGTSKAKALYSSFCGTITPKVPASILQLHKNVILIADNDALSLMNL